jgi:hypothetical protein
LSVFFLHDHILITGIPLIRQVFYFLQMAPILLYSLMGTRGVVMRFILFFMSLTASFMASAQVNVSGLSITHNSTTAIMQFNHSGGPTTFQFLIDSDLNSASGYQANGIGANYLVEDGRLYRYSGSSGGWGWTYLKTLTIYKTSSVYRASVLRSDLRSPSSINVVARVSAPLDATGIVRHNFTTSTISNAQLIFKSGFEGSTLGSPYGCSTSCWQDIFGRDANTGFAWPVRLWGNTENRFQLLADELVSPTTVGNYIQTKLVRGIGPFGTESTLLYQTVKQRSNSAAPATQVPFMISPDLSVAQGDLYVRYYVKLQPDMVQVNSTGWGRILFQWKTSSDYRISLYMRNDGRNGFPVGTPYWRLVGDNEPADGSIAIDFEELNRTAVVPVGRWMKFEYFHHRATGTAGRTWVAIDNKVIFDHRGNNMGDLGQRINRVMLMQLYHGGGDNAYQFIDNVEVWNGFPSNAAPH